MKNISEMTNEEFLVWLMNTSPFGALTQAFIIEAIRYYSEAVSKGDRPDSDPEQFIDPALWYDIGKDIQSRVVAKYESTLKES